MLSAQKKQTGRKMNRFAIAAMFLAGVMFLNIFSGQAFASQADELEKAMKVMRMLTGNEGTCTDLDADGDGKVAAGDAMLALRKAANISDMACGEGWTTIGDIPEFSFSSEPLIDENTAFTMNVDPFDQLMLTAVTTNGWTIEYFAIKDAMGVPVVLAGIHAKKDGTSEYLEVKFNGDGHPVFIEQQGEKKVALNWKNCTVYSLYDWTIIGNLPNFSSMPIVVVDNETKVSLNTDTYDSLCLTVTTSNGWKIEYFGTKGTEGYMTSMTFINAVNNSTGDSLRAKIDEYGQPTQVSKQDGVITNIDYKTSTISNELGSLSLPSPLNDPLQSMLNSMCNKLANTVSKLCPFYGLMGTLIGSPVLGFALSFGCSFGSLMFQETVCNDTPNYPKIICLTSWNLILTAIAKPLSLDILEPIQGIVSDYGMGAIADEACSDYDGTSTGDPHLNTLDRLHYDFQAVGEFVYLQSTQDPTEMTIQIRQGPWRNSKHIATNKAVAMSVGGDVVEINVAKTPCLSINNAPKTMADKEIVQLKNGCKIYAQNQNRYWVIWKDNSMALVNTHNTHLDIFVSLPDNRKGLVKGLLGNSDGDRSNDLQNRDGSKTFNVFYKLTKDALYNQFGNSWRITKEESLFTYAEGEDTSTYTDLNFPYELVKAFDLSDDVRTNAEKICRDAGITDSILLEDCILDVGMTGDPTFADNMKDITPPEQSITVTDDWLLYEDAQKAEGDKIIRITPDATWKTGMALREGALNVDGDFEKTFTIYMGDNNNGADGMVFIMLPELTPAGTSLNGGEGLGFSSACGDKPCLGVEIDTFSNSSDPSADHIALIKNGSVKHNSTDNGGLPLVPLTFNIEDNATHTMTVSWNKEAQVFSVTLDGSTVFAHEGLDLKTLLGTSTASYGFVGATGSATSEQYFYPITTLQQP